MKKAIIGNGGMGRELYFQMLDNNTSEEIIFFVEDNYAYDNKHVFPLSNFKLDVYEVIIALADSLTREKIVNSLPLNTKFFSFVHKSVQIFDSNIEIGEGTIICAGSILTTNIKIGKHALLNRNTNISHDCVIGDYFTTAPGVHISGNCSIGHHVFFGCLSSSKQKISICSNVSIGLNAGVTSDIHYPGIYIGTPAKYLKSME